MAKDVYCLSPEKQASANQDYSRQFCRRQRAGDFHILIGQSSEGTLIHTYAPVRIALKKGFEAKDPATVNVYKNLEDHYRRELISLVPQFDRFERERLAPYNQPTNIFCWKVFCYCFKALQDNFLL